MVRKTLLAITATAALLVAMTGQVLAHPPDVHLHCLTTPNGEVHSIGRGVTALVGHTHETAFHNLHGDVHLGPFNPTGDHPLGTLSADFTAPFTCPPSP